MDGEANMNRNSSAVWTITILEQEIEHFKALFNSMDQTSSFFYRPVFINNIDSI